LAQGTDWLGEQADALLSQAEVLRAAGEPEEAGAALREAVALYRKKGNTVSARRAQSMLGTGVPA
jgi:hypothetical protein